MAEIRLQETKVYSPISGVISKRFVDQGQFVQTGQPLLVVNNPLEKWIVANVEETKLGSIRPNAPVEISVDAYHGKSFHGRVLQLGGYTAAEFSLIPPNNASGNFTKVTQRVPVKISIENSSPGEHSATPLLPGMSVEVKIRVR